MKRLSCLVALALILALPATSQAASQTFIGTGSSPMGITLDSDGNAYTANRSSANLSKLSTSGALTQNFATISLGTTPNPQAIAVDSNNFIFTANSSSHNVSKISLGGSVFSDYATTGINPRDLVIDSQNNLFVANGSSVTKITSMGVASTFASFDSQTPEAITIDDQDNLYVPTSDAAPFGAGGNDQLYKITPAGSKSVIGEIEGHAEDAAVDDNGNIYVLDSNPNNNQNKILKVTPAITTTIFANLDGNSSPSKMVFDTSKNLYVTMSCKAPFDGQLSKVNPSGVVVANYSTGRCPNGLALNSTGQIFVTNRSDDSITRVTGDAGNGTISPAPPEKPVAPSAVAGEERATVTITPNLFSARFGLPSSYIIKAKETPTRSCTITPPETSCTVTGLSGGTSYTFTAQANLEAWTTSPSAPSAAVTPTAGPNPDPNPNPNPNPELSLSVTTPKLKIKKGRARLISVATASQAGKITQTVTSRKGKKQWCKTTAAASAGSNTLTCNLGSKGRRYLRQHRLKVTMVTILSTTSGQAVADQLKLAIKKKR